MEREKLGHDGVGKKLPGSVFDGERSVFLHPVYERIDLLLHKRRDLCNGIPNLCRTRITAGEKQGELFFFKRDHGIDRRTCHGKQMDAFQMRITGPEIGGMVFVQTEDMIIT